jgi:hypothetical protein
MICTYTCQCMSFYFPYNHLVLSVQIDWLRFVILGSYVRYVVPFNMIAVFNIVLYK